MQMTTIALDDGYYNNKGYAGKGRKLILPTLMKVGRSAARSLTGSLDLHTYATKNTLFDGADIVITVGKDLGEFDSIDVGDYPTSPENRIVVNHFLAQFLIPGEQKVQLITGLPLKDYYSKSLESLNVELIEAKKKNLQVPVYKHGDLQQTPITEIVEQSILAEGIAAHYDYVLTEDMVTGEVDINEERASEDNAYIDIGGRTTDIVFLEGGQTIHKDVSGSLPVGMINFRDEIIRRVAEVYSIDPQFITVKQVDRILRESTIKLDGRVHDVFHIVEEAKSMISNVIIRDVKRRLKNTRGADNLIFIGGGALQLKDAITAAYPHAVFPEDGIFANARGMYKHAKILKDSE